MSDKYNRTVRRLFGMLPDYQNVGAGAYKPGLERISEFMELLGRPDRNYPTIHVAGTNGKGSVSHMIASVLQTAGYRTGLYTSPHLKDFRERIRVNGVEVTEEFVTGFCDRYWEDFGRVGLSFFEATAAMAFEYFSEEKAEAAVIETGLGGRLDATNIIYPAVSVITNIGFDHTAYLGNTIGEIAGEKAGIMKPGVPVVIGQKQAGTTGVFARKAEELNSSLIYAEDIFSAREHYIDGVKYFTVKNILTNDTSEIHADLQGDYQKHNIITALAALYVLSQHERFSFSKPAVREGLRSVAGRTGLKGRWQIIATKPLTICDTGHNPDGLKEVMGQLRREHTGKLFIIFGVVNDKDLASIIPLLPAHAYYFFTNPSNERALPVAELADRAKAAELKGEIITDVNSALKRAGELAGDSDTIFIGGSTFTVADLDCL